MKLLCWVIWVIFIVFVGIFLKLFFIMKIFYLLLDICVIEWESVKFVIILVLFIICWGIIWMWYCIMRGMLRLLKIWRIEWVLVEFFVILDWFIVFLVNRIKCLSVRRSFWLCYKKLCMFKVNLKFVVILVIFMYC